MHPPSIPYMPDEASARPVHTARTSIPTLVPSLSAQLERRTLGLVGDTFSITGGTIKIVAKASTCTCSCMLCVCTHSGPIHPSRVNAASCTYTSGPISLCIQMVSLVLMLQRTLTVLCIAPIVFGSRQHPYTRWHAEPKRPFSPPVSKTVFCPKVVLLMIHAYTHTSLIQPQSLGLLVATVNLVPAEYRRWTRRAKFLNSKYSFGQVCWPP